MFRGSSSEQARAYKAAGHANEAAFAKLIDGKTEGLPPQGKTDCVGPDGETYSIKKKAKKWQIFLYGLERLSADPGFLSLMKLGLDLSKMLKAFPEDYNAYARDKAKAKHSLRATLASDRSGLNLEALINLIGPNNAYLKSKIQLAQVNSEIVEALKADHLREAFFRQSLFNGQEVKSMALQDAEGFLVFKADKVVDIFTNSVSVQKSGTGGHSDDLSIAGQKVIMKGPTNLVELEVRNDSNVHFRQLRFNMNRDLAVRILKENSRLGRESGSLQFRE